MVSNPTFEPKNIPFCVYRPPTSFESSLGPNMNVYDVRHKQAADTAFCQKYITDQVPMDLLTETVKEDTDFLLNERKNILYRTYNSLITFQHHTEPLVLFSGGRNFEQLILRPLDACIPAVEGDPSPAFSLSNESRVHNLLTLQSHPLEHNAHILAQSDYHITYYRSQQLDRIHRLRGDPPSDGSKTFNMIIDPVEKYRLPELIHTITSQPLLEAAFLNIHSCLYFWNPNTGVVPHSETPLFDSFDGTTETMRIESTSHPCLFQLSRQNSLYSVDKRCKQPILLFNSNERISALRPSASLSSYSFLSLPNTIAAIDCRYTKSFVDTFASPGHHTSLIAASASASSTESVNAGSRSFNIGV